MTGDKGSPGERTAGANPGPRPMPSLLVRALLGLVRLYQAGLSPLLGPRCRFEPTCSQYMAEALRIHGVRKGGLLGLWRLLRCHPFSGGGYDPVGSPTVQGVSPGPSAPPIPGTNGVLRSRGPTPRLGSAKGRS